MEENTNRTLAVNSVILYVRLVLTSVFAVLTTRFALRALGVLDFGLFSVLGSVMSFIAIINTIMISTSNRFIAVAIGKGLEREIREQFNINLLIHIAVAIFTLLLAYPIGEWYIGNHLNFDGDLSIAKKVFYISIAGSAVSFIGVPYNGLLMAKERFVVFCSVETLCSFLKLILAFVLIYVDEYRLMIYAIGLSFLSAMPTLIYHIYCYIKYKEYVRFEFVRDRKKYHEVMSFSMWIGYGAVACVGKSQGAALLINKFFSTIMNTALGIANSVNSMVTMVASTITQPIAPQLTKAYAAGDFEKSERLLIWSVKLGYFAMLVIAVPMLLEIEWILKIWLGEVPEYSVMFSNLMIVDALIISLNSGISTIIFASGKIKLYQVLINTLRLLSVLAAYLMLYYGAGPEWLLITYIIFSVIIFFVMQYVLHITLNYSNTVLFKRAYLPSLYITVLLIPVFLLIRSLSLHPLLRMSISVIALLPLIYLLGLSHEEKDVVNCFINKYLKRN